MTLPRRRRLSARELPAVLRGRPAAVDELFSLRVQKRAGEAFRCAVVAPSSIAKGPAVRNRLRRRVADAVRRIIQSNEIRGGGRCLVMLRTRELPSTPEMQLHLLVLLKKSGIVSS